jgi:hypothetical protein
MMFRHGILPADKEMRSQVVERLAKLLGLKPKELLVQLPEVA